VGARNRCSLAFAAVAEARGEYQHALWLCTKLVAEAGPTIDTRVRIHPCWAVACAVVGAGVDGTLALALAAALSTDTGAQPQTARAVGTLVRVSAPGEH